MSTVYRCEHGRFAFEWCPHGECKGRGCGKPAEQPPEVPCEHPSASQALDDDGEWHCLKCELLEVPAPDALFAVVDDEGRLLGSYDHDDHVDGASAVARAVPGSNVVRYVRAKEGGR